jgi:hypothetical protein
LRRNLFPEIRFAKVGGRFLLAGTASFIIFLACEDSLLLVGNVFTGLPSALPDRLRARRCCVERFPSWHSKKQCVRIEKEIEVATAAAYRLVRLSIQRLRFTQVKMNRTDQGLAAYPT